MTGRLLVMVGLAMGVCGCRSAAPPARGDATVLPGGVGEAVARVLAAAEGCDLQVAGAESEPEGKVAKLVLLDQWRDPQPESAVLLVAVDEGAGVSTVRVISRSLADYGRPAPSFGGHGFPSCTPCAAAAVGGELAVFSPSRALAAAHRARACLLGKLAP
ncbi:MAG: hypothetical protein HRF46_09725 [Acidobacteriota bacterium]|jgi:hypothetical protein